MSIRHELGRNYPPDLGILADARTFLRQLLAELERRKPRERRAQGLARRDQGWQHEWDAFTRPNFDIHATPIRPERIVADCQAVLPDDAILACDVGVNHNWYMQFWKARRPQTHAQLLGLLRHGLRRRRRARRQARRARPAGGGDRRRRLLHHGAARAVHRGRVRHPGGVGDLEQFRLGSIRDIQYGMFGGRELGTAFYQGANKKPYNPDFAAWARASGVEGVTVTKSQDFKGALEHAVKAEQAVPARRPCRRRGAAAVDRRLGTAADALQGAGLRASAGFPMSLRRSEERMSKDERRGFHQEHRGDAVAAISRITSAARCRSRW